MENEKETKDLRSRDAAAADLSGIFDYPAIGELFSTSDSRRLDEFKAKLSSTRQELDRIIRHGKTDEAERAQRAARGIETTLEFLTDLESRRDSTRG